MPRAQGRALLDEGCFVHVLDGGRGARQLHVHTSNGAQVPGGLDGIVEGEGLVVVAVIAVEMEEEDSWAFALFKVSFV